MTKLQTTAFVLSIFFFISCKKERNEVKITKKKNEIIENKKMLFNDFIKSYKPQRVNLNPDNIPEYIFSEFGEFTFFDGKTKKEIEYIDPRSPKRGNDELEFIDVICNDNQKEFIAESLGGGTMGSYHYISVMRYNSKTQKINSIFDYEISSFSWVENEEKLDFVYYIDILYNKKNECVDTIKVFNGKFINNPESYSLKIKPQKLIEKYYFNEKNGTFEKNKTNK